MVEMLWILVMDFIVRESLCLYVVCVLMVIVFEDNCWLGIVDDVV